MFGYSYFGTNDNEVKTPRKTMTEYYQDLAKIVEFVRENVANANDDESFAHAADVIDQVIELCQNIETVDAGTANDINTERATLFRTIGKDGLIDVTGEASRLLAIKFNELQQAQADAKYWPSKDCPIHWLARKSLYTEYNANFENKYKPRLNEKIKLLAGRIEEYDNSLKGKRRM